MKRYLLQTFGCQMNVHDSRRIEEVLHADGYRSTDSPELADVVLFNTCSVREKAEHKLFSMLGTFKPYKQQRPGMVIGVAGCMAQEHGEAMLREQPLLDLLIGPDNIGELPEMLRNLEQGAAPIARAHFDHEAPRFLSARARGDEVCSYVTVMKGCDERCSFCIVPYTRGSERYRPAREIIDEIARAVDGGVREVTLLGQTVNSWHEPSQASTGESQFAELLRAIAREVPGLWRLRYTSPHPRHITPALVAAHRELELLPAHVHLPVQSGSDRVLKRMIRRYRRAEFVERAAALQAAREGLTLSTDIIVGFPGESEEDFAQTLSLVEEVGFVAVFGFKYSKRPHTPALKLDGDVAEEEKAERLARLFALVDRQQSRHLQGLVGTRTRVLIEGASKKTHDVAPGSHRYSGRSERHEIVHVDAPQSRDLTGRVLEVEIVEANKRSLVGRPIGGLPPRRLPVMSS